MRSRSPKSNHFFPMSKWCLYASLVKIHQLVKVTKIWSNRQTIPTIVYEVWPESTNWSRSPKSDQIIKPSQPSYMKFGQNPPIGQGHQNLIKSSNHPNHRIWSLARIHQLVKVTKIWSNRQTIQNHRIWSFARIHQLVKVTKIWSNRQTIPTIVYEVWPESTNWSRSPKSDQIVKPSQPSYMKFGQNPPTGQGHQNLIKSSNHPNHRIWSLARIHQLVKVTKIWSNRQTIPTIVYEVWPESRDRVQTSFFYSQSLKTFQFLLYCDLEN